MAPLSLCLRVVSELRLLGTRICASRIHDSFRTLLRAISPPATAKDEDFHAISEKLRKDRRIVRFFATRTRVLGDSIRLLNSPELRRFLVYQSPAWLSFLSSTALWDSHRRLVGALLKFLFILASCPPVLTLWEGSWSYPVFSERLLMSIWRRLLLYLRSLKGGAGR